MRVFSCLMLFILVGFTTANYNYLVLSSKKISVDGSTSIGSFSCKYDFQVKDTLFLNRKQGLLQKVPIREFGCGNFLLNRDFKKTLKEKEYPEVLISLGDVRKQGNYYSYNLYLDLAGEKKSFQNLVLTKEGKNLTGSIALKFSDFNLVAPKKLGGAIKIREEIKLSIVLKTQEN